MDFLQLETFVTKIISNSLTCKCIEDEGYSYHSTTDLIKSRLSTNYSFSFRELNYAGPVSVENVYKDSKIYSINILVYLCFH